MVFHKKKKDTKKTETDGAGLVFAGRRKLWMKYVEWKSGKKNSLMHLFEAHFLLQPHPTAPHMGPVVLRIHIHMGVLDYVRLYNNIK